MSNLLYVDIGARGVETEYNLNLPHTVSWIFFISVRRILKSLTTIVLPLVPARVSSIVLLILLPIPTATILTSLSCKRNYFDMNWACIVREGFSSQNFCKGCAIAGLDWMCAGLCWEKSSRQFIGPFIYVMQLKVAFYSFQLEVFKLEHLKQLKVFTELLVIAIALCKLSFYLLKTNYCFVWC